MSLLESRGPEFEAAKENLIDFMLYDGRGEWSREPHLELLCDKLQAVSEGKTRRLMVFMPPRHGKSQVCSKKFPAWHLGRNPKDSIILASYSADLALDFSAIARETLRDSGGLFPGAVLDPSASAKGRWAIKGYPEGGMIAAGVGGPITGRGANIAIIDDPIKNYEEACSETTRNAVWQWYKSTLRTRLAPGGAIVLIMTRWHEGDLAGLLLDQAKTGEGEQWDVVSLPAIAGDDDQLGRVKGETLSPRFPASELDEIKKAVGLQLWTSLYQQTPRPDEGGYFHSNWFNSIDNPDLRRQSGIIVSACDLSIGDKETNDWVCIGTGLLTVDLESILLDVRRFRVSDPDYSAYEIAGQVVDVQRMYNPALFGFEDGQIFKSIWPVIRSEAKDARVPINERALVPVRDKQARARIAQAWMRKGRCYFPETEWLDAFIDELLGFPNGKWDDQVDMFAWLMVLIHEMSGDIDKYSGAFR